MPSSFSTDLKLELMVTGENAGTWGTKTNTNLNLLQQAIAGYQNISIAGGAQTTALTMDNAAISNARNAVIKFTGTITGNQVVTVPNGIEKTYTIYNGTTGAFTVQFKTVSGTGVTFSTTDKGVKLVYVDGTDVVDILTGPLSEVTLSTPLAPSSGGTGLSSPGASGNVLVSNGTAWTSGTGIPSGVILLWSGSIASIPSGFALCDGTSGTPDLRNRFLVGAGSTYAVNNTGGSANAIVVSHTHTIGTTSLTGGVNSISQSFNSGGSATGVFTKQTGSPTGDTPISADTNDCGSFTIDASHTHTLTTEGSSGTNANLPPYFALAYIMKL
jgi:hypothetical protein